jgi:MerR family mercuric resistance operon transcriptional regulator
MSTITNERAIAIGELSRRTGANIETIRYYERIGMMPAPLRSQGGRRLYTEDQSRRLAFIRRARTLGFLARSPTRRLVNPSKEASAPCSAQGSVGNP